MIAIHISLGQFHERGHFTLSESFPGSTILRQPTIPALHFKVGRHKRYEDDQHALVDWTLDLPRSDPFVCRVGLLAIVPDASILGLWIFTLACPS